MFHYPRHIGDYQKDTGHLDMREDGAYQRLMDLAYDSEKPLTLDFDALCRKVRARSPEERAAVEVVLKDFWKRTAKGWVQKRILSEIERFRGFLKHQSDAGKKSAETRRNQRSTGKQPPLNGGSTGGQPESNLTENQRTREPENREPATGNEPALPPGVQWPAGFPDSEGKAVAWVEGLALSLPAGVPPVDPEFTREIWRKMPGIGFKDGAGRQVEHWGLYVRGRWCDGPERSSWLAKRSLDATQKKEGARFSGEEPTPHSAKMPAVDDKGPGGWKAAGIELYGEAAAVWEEWLQVPEANKKDIRDWLARPPEKK